MKQKILILIIFVFPFSAFAQFIYNNPFNTYSEISIAEKLQPSGIGSYGFNSKVNYFNPNYFSEDNKLGINIFGTINISAKKAFVNGADQTIEYVTNKVRLLPDFSINYKLDDYLANLCYVNNFQFNGSVNNRNELYFTAGQGRYLLIPENSLLNIKNSVLQISLSRKLGENNSIALGIATNFFDYNYSFNNSQATYILRSNYNYELKTASFNNYQFLVSFNHINNDGLSYYLLYKSPVSHLGLEPGNISINDTVGFVQHAEMYYPEYLAYGIQFNQIKNISISFEIMHEKETANTSAIDSKVSLGFNSHLFYPIQLGLLGSVYISKHYDLNMGPDGITSFFNNFDNSKFPFDLDFFAEYPISKLEFSLGYQYASGPTNVYNNSSSTIYLGVGYSIL